MRSFFSGLVLFLFSIGPVTGQDYKVDHNFTDGYTLVYKPGTEKLYGVINEEKKIVVPLEYKAIRSTTEKGIFEIKDRSTNAGLYSALRQKVLLEPQFYEIENFSEGLAVVKKRTPDNNFVWGAVDVNGKMVIPVEYEYLGPSSEGLMNFKKDKKFGFLDNTNKIVIPPMYFDFATFSDGLAPARLTPDGKYGYIDKLNNLVIAAEYEDANPFYRGYASVAKKKGYTMGGAGKPSVKVPGEYVLINKTGKVLQAKTFERISFKNPGGLFIIELNGKKGVMDSTGQPLLPIGYDQVDIDKNGFIIFKLDGKYGMMGSRGSSILQPKYDQVSHTNYNRYYTKLKGKYEVGDINGNIFIPADSANGVLLGKKRIVYYYNNLVKVFDLNGNLQNIFTDLNLKNYGHSLSPAEDHILLNTETIVQKLKL